jgi:DNA polymerase elongation subunit (family B)
MYENVAVLDVASMHPTSIEFSICSARTPRSSKTSSKLASRSSIKDYDAAAPCWTADWRLFWNRFRIRGDLEDPVGLANALKIVINIVYGLTSAKFDNPFRDIRNVDNIVAKRGALFMIDLKHALQDQGVSVIHIKTDSVKIPNATSGDHRVSSSPSAARVRLRLRARGDLRPLLPGQ